MFCKYCGEKISENVKFCPNCGAPIEEPEPKSPFDVLKDESFKTAYKNSCEEPMPDATIWIILNAISIFTCCQVTGIIGLVYAILANTAIKTGDKADAIEKIKTSKACLILGVVMGIVSAFIVMGAGFSAP